MDNDDALEYGEVMTKLDEVLTLHVNAPMKRALRATAAKRHISVADIVRQAIDEHARSKYPEYSNLYKKFMLDEVKRTGFDKLMDEVEQRFLATRRIIDERPDE